MNARLAIALILSVPVLAGPAVAAGNTQNVKASGSAVKAKPDVLQQEWSIVYETIQRVQNDTDNTRLKAQQQSAPKQ